MGIKIPGTIICQKNKKINNFMCFVDGQSVSETHNLIL